MVISNFKNYTKINDFCDSYLKMKISGIEINCPYWMNKIKNGKVIIRGFANGKGSALEIQDKLNSISSINKQKILSRNFFYKLARRNRIGIDCSGFAYRFLDMFIKLKYKNANNKSMNKYITQGINRTDVKLLTSETYCSQIPSLKDIQIGDLIRMMKGHHVLVVIGVDNNEITYIHSSDKTLTKGVHKGVIKIDKPECDLSEQIWLEKTKNGENYCQKYFYKSSGDGIYRLNLFI
jgi:hypothetical protein